MKNRLKVLLVTTLLGVHAFSQTPQETSIKNRLTRYFQEYTNSSYINSRPGRKNQLLDVSIDQGSKVVTLNTNKTFGEQPFTKESIQKIRKEVVELLQPPYNTYSLRILSDSIDIEEMCAESTLHTWGSIDYKGNPWVMPLSQPYQISHGLQGRHLTLWASHGRYYKNDTGMWSWQRPRLYTTCEDLFTQTFMVPFLMPMLENAGAIVFTPRERDWQKNEVVVDNDTPWEGGAYREENGKYEWRTANTGFAKKKDVYLDKENPFADGTARQIEAQVGKRQCSTITWTPNIPEDGSYAVYVSYKTMPTSVSDALYTVHHRGISTKFRVNQQMGGSTWVYLGTFDFKKGQSTENCVTLSNTSNYRGVITADAVRFGGGMGIIARGDSLGVKIRSGLPRYLEGARYNAQYSGMPYPIYGTKESLNDYGEDINARSLMMNHIARGSVFVPYDTAHTDGGRVPFEMCLALHSDAGSQRDESIVGTLGIYTTGFYDGKLGAGISRLSSRSLCDHVMSHVTSDMQYYCGNWTRREMRDENYSETREPQVPSMILEMFSHQNWADMKRGHDPTFKMLFSRAIYKGVLDFVSHMHGKENSVVQPLPVNNFSVITSIIGDSVRLTWQPTADPTDPTAMPTQYIVYEATGDGGYDNGTLCYNNFIKLPISQGEIHRYKVAAVNEGGESLPSEELCAYSCGMKATRQILIVNAFTRLASPQPVDDGTVRGFDILEDPGVQYMYSPGFCGKQVYWNMDGFGMEGPNGLGNSGNEYEGMLVAGNTFNYPSMHAHIITTMDGMNANISSISRGAAEQMLANNQRWSMVDLILGTQRNDGYSMTHAPALSDRLCDALEGFLNNGASLMTSGAFIASDTKSNRAARFLSDKLHCTAGGQIQVTDSTRTITGFNTHLTLRQGMNETIFPVSKTDILNPTNNGFGAMLYKENSFGAAIGYQGKNSRTMTFGFPLECIENEETRSAIIQATVRFLLQ